VAGPSGPERLALMSAGLDHFWEVVEAAGRSPSSAWRAELETAVMEIVGNVVRHAYPPGHKPGNVKLRLRLYADRVEALVTDRGVPFDEPAPKRPLDTGAPLALPERGYGLAVARAAVDQLDYSRRARGSNRWRLVKRLRG